MKTRVAAIQMTSTDDVEANIATALRLCGEAIREGARLIVIPEGFAFIGPEEGKRLVAEPLPQGGPILSRMAEFARNTKTELVLGGFWEKSDGLNKVKNACVYIDENGNVKAIYRKIHLFDVTLSDGTVIKESETVSAGSEPVVVSTRFGILGLSICYDLRFPELYRDLVDMGAIAMAIPAAFTRTTGIEHWHVLLRARAIESLSYVIAAAQVGHHFGSRFTYGHAMICDPWGRVLAELGETEGVALADIDPQIVERVRKEFPALQHRRLGLSKPM
jgi:deaminated glutathione amidase